MSKTYMEEKNEVGRPCGYKKKYTEMLIEHMSQGGSFSSFAGVIGVGKNTIYEWLKKFPEFQDAKHKGRAKAELWWENLGKAAILGRVKDFNGQTFRLMTGNMFNWSEKQKIEVEMLKPSIIKRLDGSQEILGHERPQDSIEADYEVSDEE